MIMVFGVGIVRNIVDMLRSIGIGLNGTKDCPDKCSALLCCCGFGNYDEGRKQIFYVYKSPTRSRER